MNVAQMYPQRHFLPQPHFYHQAPLASSYPYWPSHTTSYGSQLAAGPSTLCLPVQHAFTFTVPYPTAQVRRPTWAPGPQHDFALGINSAPHQPQFQTKAAAATSTAAVARPCLSPLLLAELPEFRFPPSPTDTCSSRSSALTPPPPAVASQPQQPHVEPRVVCAVPLVAPRPLPYHSPHFLQFEDLPDMSEDLSHPPYVQRQKRKRGDDGDDGEDREGDVDMGGFFAAHDGGAPPAKRAALAPVSWNGSRHRRLAPPPPRVPSVSRWTDGTIRYPPQVARG